MMPVHDRRLKRVETKVYTQLSVTEGANNDADHNDAEDRTSILDDGASVSIEVISVTGGLPLVAKKQLSGSGESIELSVDVLDDTQKPGLQPSAQQRLDQIDHLKQRQQEQMQALLLQQTQVHWLCCANKTIVSLVLLCERNRD